VFVVAFTVPMAVAWITWNMSAHKTYTRALLPRGDARALHYIAHAPGNGPVLTSYRLGALVPEVTGRRTYLGDWAWSVPDFGVRRRRVRALLAGTLGPGAAADLLRIAVPQYLLAPCGASTTLAPTLGRFVARRRRFGCATVYTIRGDRPGLIRAAA
jgi:hypothetical protein